MYKAKIADTKILLTDSYTWSEASSLIGGLI